MAKEETKITLKYFNCRPALVVVVVLAFPTFIFVGCGDEGEGEVPPFLLGVETTFVGVVVLQVVAVVVVVVAEEFPPM